MNRLLVALLALALSVAVLPACDGDEPAADDEATEEVEEQEEETEEAAQPQEAEAGDLITDTADVFTSIVGLIGEVSNFQCQCHPEMMGFESTEECAEATGDQEESLEQFHQCVVDALTGAEGEPPAEAREQVDCMRDAIAGVETCFEDLSDEHEDICTEEGQAAFANCAEQMEAAMDQCETDEEDEWIDSVEDELDACMAQAIGM